MQSAMQGVAWGVLACLLADLCRSEYVRRIFTGGVCSILTLSVIFELGSWAIIDCQFGLNEMSLILNTNASEAGGFFSHFFSAKTGLKLFLYFLVFIVGWQGLSIITRRCFSAKKHQAARAVILIAATLCGCVLIALYAIACLANLGTPANATKAYALLSHNHKIDWIADNSDPITKNAMLLRDRFALNKGVDDWEEYQTQVWREQDDIVSNDSIKYNVGVIFGESMIKHMYELNEFNSRFLPTLKAEADSGRLVQFTDMMTSDSFTHRALRNAVMLSDLRETDFSQGVYFPMLAAKAGWEVDFYSNQVCSKYGDYDLSRIFLSELNRTKVYRQWNDSKFGSDADWLDYVERKYYTHEATHKRLSIYHFLSIHFPWKSRHFQPGHFSADDFPAEWPETKRSELAEYASAMWENDSIVGRIFNHFNENGPAVVVWFSDHGEFLNFETRDTSRCKEDFADPQWVKSCFEVPMFIWMNDEFISQNPELTEEIRQASSRPGTTDNIGHAILHLLGIRGKYYRSDLDILSPDYIPHQRFDVKGHNLDLLKAH